MEVLKESRKIKEKHTILHDKLRSIPENRKMAFRIDTIDGNKIGKPRFEERFYAWPKEMYKELRDHLQDLRNFFDLHSYWFDTTLRQILDSGKRRQSKKSIMFLLERDVWETDEVYGDYLIEKHGNKTKISYFRRDLKIKSIDIDTTDDSIIEQWICNDAINQIKEQFTFLWNKIMDEIHTVEDERYRKKPKISLSKNYLKEQFKKVKNTVDDWPESALLNLGRIMEIWLLIELNRSNSPGLSFLIRHAEIEKLIDKHQSKLLGNINDEYNKLKHYLQHTIDQKKIDMFIKDFNSIFYRK